MITANGRICEFEFMRRLAPGEEASEARCTKPATVLVVRCWGSRERVVRAFCGEHADMMGAEGGPYHLVTCPNCHCRITR
jgi:hypothetical protein